MSQLFGSKVTCRIAGGRSMHANAAWPRQYTIESSMMVRYLPRNASAMNAPITGKKYALATNHATHSRASESV